MTEKNDSFSVPEILDVTAVEVAKIHEEAETKRKAISEAEETKRKLATEREQTTRQRYTDKRARWTDDSFLTMLGVTLGIMFICAMTGGLFYSCKRYPDAPSPPKACVETIKVYHANEVNTHCEEGAAVESKPTPSGDIEVRCICNKRAQ